MNASTIMWGFLQQQTSQKAVRVAIPPKAPPYVPFQREIRRTKLISSKYKSFGFPSQIATSLILMAATKRNRRKVSGTRLAQSTNLPTFSIYLETTKSALLTSLLIRHTGLQSDQTC